MTDTTSPDAIRASLARTEKSANWEPHCATQVALTCDGNRGDRSLQESGKWTIRKAPLDGDGAE